MSNTHDETRSLTSVPVGSLGLIPMAGCEELGDKIDYYLVKWRKERENEHRDNPSFQDLMLFQDS